MNLRKKTLPRTLQEKHLSRIQYLGSKLRYMNPFKSKKKVTFNPNKNSPESSSSSLRNKLSQILRQMNDSKAQIIVVCPNGEEETIINANIDSNTTSSMNLEDPPMENLQSEILPTEDQENPKAQLATSNNTDATEHEPLANNKSSVDPDIRNPSSEIIVIKEEITSLAAP